jgi:hypothetical protein
MKLMIHSKISLLSISLVLFISGCIEKDELTLPVKVDLMIGISENSSKDEYLTFTGGKIGVKRIQFEGKREAGGDVFFETDPKMNLPPLTFNTSAQPVVISDFDIPQGIFNYMKWDINLKGILIDELTYDDDDDIDSPYIGLVISGTYSYLSRSSIPFIIAIDDTEQLSVKSFDPEGNSQVVLSVNKDYEAILILDPAYAFHSISRESLEEADVSDDSGTPIIVISSDENEDLYEDLLYRIAQSARVLVK